MFTFKNRVPLGGVSSVASFITTDEQLMKIEAAVFPCRLCFLRAFTFFFSLINTVHILFLVALTPILFSGFFVITVVRVEQHYFKI